MLSIYVLEALNAGGFYSSGQHGTASTNHGNALRGNHFSNILNHAEGMGVQRVSVQAMYLNDQQSDWTATGSTSVACIVVVLSEMVCATLWKEHHL